jgi:hypothetical protein
MFYHLKEIKFSIKSRLDYDSAPIGNFLRFRGLSYFLFSSIKSPINTVS